MNESPSEARARLKLERESSELTLRLVRQIVDAPAISDRKARDLLRTLLALPAVGRTYGAERAAKAADNADLKRKAISVLNISGMTAPSDYTVDEASGVVTLSEGEQPCSPT